MDRRRFLGMGFAAIAAAACGERLVLPTQTPSQDQKPALSASDLLKAQEFQKTMGVELNPSISPYGAVFYIVKQETIVPSGISRLRWFASDREPYLNFTKEDLENGPAVAYKNIAEKVTNPIMFNNSFGYSWLFYQSAIDGQFVTIHLDLDRKVRNRIYPAYASGTPLPTARVKVDNIVSTPKGNEYYAREGYVDVSVSAFSFVSQGPSTRIIHAE